MMVLCIYNNFFPCDRKPASIVATSSLVVAVASVVLLGIACGLHWGTPAIATLAALTGVCLLIPIFISFCKKIWDRTYVPEEVPVSQRFPHAFGDDFVADFEDTPSQTSLKALYYLVKKDDLSTFKDAIVSYPPDDLYSLCFCSGSLWVDPEDETTTLSKKEKRYHGQTLFHVIISQKDQAKKENFLDALFTHLEDHEVGVHQKFFLSEMLKIQTLSLINLCFDKFNKETIEKILLQALEECNTVWTEAFFQRRSNNKLIKDSISDFRLCEALMKSPLDVQQKNHFLTKVASLRAKTLDTFEMEGYTNFGGYCTNNLTLLHLAIQSGNEEMVQFFVAYKQLIDKPSLLKDDALTPLHCAIILGNLNMVKILLAAGADKTAVLKSGWFLDKRFSTQPITPKMLATGLGHQDIADLLS